MEREAIEAAIRSAFAGIRLGSGVSLRQAQIMDSYGAGLTRAEIDVHLQTEIVDDWTRVPDEELLRDCIAYLDPDGLRYYLPALMLWLLRHYNDEDRLFINGVDMTVIGTIAALTERDHVTFSSDQQKAMAAYLDALPRIVDLDDDDAVKVERAMDRYWRQFLAGS